MQKQRIKARVSDLVLNEGQLQWLPKNPRQWTPKDVSRTVSSLERDPDFQEDHPLLVISLGDKLLVFAGNLRTTAAKELQWETFEAILYQPETDEDKETIKRRSILDNGSFGSWDYDTLANEWDVPLLEWGVPAWNTEAGEEGSGEPAGGDKEKGCWVRLSFDDEREYPRFVSEELPRLEGGYSVTITKSL